MQRRTLRTAQALHARPLDRLVRAVRGLTSTVRLRFGAREVDGRNVTSLLLLGVPAGAEVTLTVEGADEEAGLELLAGLLTAAAEAAGASAPALPPPAVVEDRDGEEDEDEATFEALGGLLGSPSSPGLALPAPVVPVAPVAPVAAPPRRAVPPRSAQPLTRGEPGAPGRAVGRAHREAGRPREWAPSRGAEAEAVRLQRARTAAQAATEALLQPDDPFSQIFAAQRTLLDDPGLQEALAARVAAGAAAEAAIVDEFAALEAGFAELGAGFAAERHADVADVRDRLLLALGLAEEAGPDTEEPLILILEEATPSRLALLDLSRVAGVISARGGPTSHAAIVARGRGVPLVFALAPALGWITAGERICVDGDTGLVCRATDAVEPAPRPAAAQPRAQGQPLRVALRANLGAPGDLATARRLGAQGSGLVRTELLYARRAQAPSPEEQAEAYSAIALALAPHLVVVRLFDAGSDKPLAFLPAPAEEPNPALGRRGVRLLLEHPEVLEAQLQAIAAARRATGCDLKAMVPMLVDAGELEAVRALTPAGCPLGSMIETPAAALLVDDLAPRSAFLSVGSNDLAQYVTASDREAGGGGLHPAVLRLLVAVARAARAAGIECGVCGELAGDPRTAPLLVGLGVDALSLAPARLPAVRAALEGFTPAALEALAARALGLTDRAALEQLLEEAPGGPR